MVGADLDGVGDQFGRFLLGQCGHILQQNGDLWGSETGGSIHRALVVSTCELFYSSSSESPTGTAALAVNLDSSSDCVTTVCVRPRVCPTACVRPRVCLCIKQCLSVL